MGSTYSSQLSELCALTHAVPPGMDPPLGEQEQQKDPEAQSAPHLSSSLGNTCYRKPREQYQGALSRALQSMDGSCGL